MNFKESDFLIAGQLKTSRTETLEEYLRNRIFSLGVIGFMSPFASYSESRCTLYQQGVKSEEFSLPSYTIKKVNPWKQPLICVSFLVYIYSFFLAAFKLKKKFDVFIGIATFSTMLGLFLKKTGRVKKVIYYCLDYYPKPKGFNFNRFVNFVFRNIDKWVVKRADVIWHISPKIKEARQKYAKVDPNSYREVVVPLGYTKAIDYDLPLNERRRWSLGFVGTLSENQGLQMVIEAMVELRNKYPQIKVEVVGHGPYAQGLKKKVCEKNLENQFIFHGFIRDDWQVYDILSHCVVGLATWTGDEEDNSLYADPGKPKLYALLGLPIIITSAPYVAKVISNLGAGEVIEYKKEDFIEAVDKMISDENKYKKYKEGLEKFKPLCLADNIFDKAMKESFK